MPSICIYLFRSSVWPGIKQKLSSNLVVPYFFDSKSDFQVFFNNYVPLALNNQLLKHVSTGLNIFGPDLNFYKSWQLGTSGLTNLITATNTSTTPPFVKWQHQSSVNLSKKYWASVRIRSGSDKISIADARTRYKCNLG